MTGVVFIETRNKPGLAKIFEDHLKFVPSLSPFVFCSKENEYQFKDYDKLIIDHPVNITDYNYMMTSVKFWNKIPFDKVLICEHESGILREGIEEFLEWDYVGAPWWFQKYGGNGGFSFRSVNAMKSICESVQYTGRGNEDSFFCDQMYGSTMFKLAPREVCEKFSVETVYKLGTFGYHLGSDARRMLSANEINKILNYA